MMTCHKALGFERNSRVSFSSLMRLSCRIANQKGTTNRPLGKQTSQELLSAAWSGPSFECRAQCLVCISPMALVSLGREQLALQVWVFNAGNFSINLRVMLFFSHFSPQETKIKFVFRDNFYIAVLPA